MAPRSKKTKRQVEQTAPAEIVALVWLKAYYSFHTYAYRDPRSVFAAAVGCPVVSPTTVLLGIVSTLFRLGKEQEAKRFLAVSHQFRVIVESPQGMIFFRAFHQLRRYETDKYDKANPRLGLTKINQGTREYGLVDGTMSVFVGVHEELREATQVALTNLTHLGTHDSMCSLIEDVQEVDEPRDVLYHPNSDLPKERMIELLRRYGTLTAVTLSRFIPFKPLSPTTLIDDDKGNKQGYWWMTGGEETETVPYVIPGKFVGTTRGKLYLK